ncbi:MAG: response regulator [Omnitrophica bacterium]|nr:response regulator [Candidatus Omnitrophota bacterium]
MAAKRILIIDDDVDFIESTRVVLETKGYEVFSAQNKQEGLKEIKSISPNLIILDVMMDKMSDGFELAREFKADAKHKNIPILMLTAVGAKTGFKFSAVGGDNAWLPVDDYCEKPIEPKKLIEKVEKLLLE